MRSDYKCAQDGQTNMFRKLVSNLMYSPSMMGSFGVYAERLKHEEFARRIGLIITTIAVAAHAISVIQPPASANTASPNDLISGGVSELHTLLDKYDNNERNLQDILMTLGITRAELAAAKEGTASLKNTAYITGRTAGYSYQAGEREYTFEKANGDTSTIYLYKTENLALDRRANYPAFISHSKHLGKFAILQTSGNVVLAQAPHIKTPESTCQFDETLNATAAKCQPCPSDVNLGVSAATCATPFLFSKSATNASQRQPAQSAPAQASDRILYTIDAKNISDTTAQVTLADHINDVLEYADVIDTDGGIFDPSTATLSWPEESVKPGASATKTFAVRLKPHLAATAQGVSNPTSYDCVMSNTYGNSLYVPVSCPFVKHVERVANTLPTVQGFASLAASMVFLLCVAYFYLRARLLREEVRLIRKDINTGVLS